MIRVLLADDEGMIRSVLAALLRLEDDIDVIAECADGEQAIAEATRLKPDVCLLDLEMPGPDGVEVAERLRRTVATRCVIVTRHARPGVLRRALASGVAGFLPSLGMPQRWPPSSAESPMARGTSTLRSRPTRSATNARP